LQIDVALVGQHDRQVQAHRVGVAPSLPDAGHVARIGQVGDDPLRGTLGDADRRADLADTDLRIVGDAQQSQSVIGEELERWRGKRNTCRYSSIHDP
jgi:hypothetical protein